MANILIVHEDGQVAASLAAAVQSGGHSVLGMVSSGAGAGPHLAKADVAIISIYLSDVDGFDLIRQCKSAGVVPIPALQGSEGGDVWQRILANDLRDVLVGIQDSHSVLQVIESAQAHAASAVGQEDGGAYVISVASARGGVGKSIFAINLAISMARFDAKVAFLDFSMFPGDAFLMLDVVPRNTIADLLGQGEMDQALLNSLMSKHPHGFSYLACPNEEFDIYSFDYESAIALLRAARTLFDYVVVDTGVYDLPPTNAAVDEADLIFLITTRDLARVMSSQRLIRNYKGRDFPEEKIKVIINHAEEGAELSEAEIEELLEHPVTAYLPSVGIETTFSINSGKPLASEKPDTPMIRVINKLAEYSIQRWAS